MTTADMLVTLSVDDLRPGDEIRLVGRCFVIRVDALEGMRRVVYVRQAGSGRENGVWLRRYSRIEVLSDVSGRGALATPQHVTQASESMEETKA